MKTKFLSILAVSALLFASCDSNEPTPVVKGKEELTGNITADRVLDANVEYNMTGAVYVKEGVTLTIPAGTTIKATAGGTNVFLLVERGAKINANGTADKPIVFTSIATDPKPGDWGGILINGKARISGPAGTVAENNNEVGNNYKYGGNVDDDNSGTLNYVRIEYTGARISEKKEHNGLTLSAVGNKTTISNIYIPHGDDDAIEFFGGSVNVSNVFVVNANDDMFDCTEGYTGTWTNFYGIREEQYTAISGDPNGIEADGNSEGDNPTHVNQSNFKVNGITIINNAPGSGVNRTMQNVFRIRRGAKATITNAFVKFGPKTNIINAEGKVEVNLIDQFDSSKGNGATGTSIEYTVDPANNADKLLTKFVPGTTLTPKTDLKGANTAAFAWTGYKF